MKEKNRYKPLIGVICVALVLIGVLIAAMLDKYLSDAALNAGLSTEPSGDQLQGNGDGFPVLYEIPEYGLVIEKLAPYDGVFVEDGSNANIRDVAMLQVYNKGDLPVEYAQLSVTCGLNTMLFEISALPVGERVVVQEKNKKTITAARIDSVSALVSQREEMGLSEDKIKVIDNGDNTLTIQNLTNEVIDEVRIFYKYYMEEEGLYVGGIAFTVSTTRLGANAKQTLQPAHFTSQTSRGVMVLTYDSEV